MLDDSAELEGSTVVLDDSTLHDGSTVVLDDSDGIKHFKLNNND